MRPAMGGIRPVMGGIRPAMGGIRPARGGIRPGTDGIRSAAICGIRAPIWWMEICKVQRNGSFRF